MVDIHSREIRSKNMRAIKSCGNKSTERKAVILLRQNKISGWKRQYKQLKGTPDFVFVKQRMAIFVDGCFWHGCPKCYKAPRTNRKFWAEKIEKNVNRDRKTDKIIRNLGWKSLHFWEHDFKYNSERVVKKIKAEIKIY
ncbi:MAG: mismatch endonuclease Vsr protein [Candidatus Woesebacteria bacterium GW2011_GWC1_43_10b]|uniref:Mismatch endonuclease Vsr protein n=1 Tax=Candidatus Woesebacteria bacterium GW2011_GWC1_43_10b TaxID=1618585 RepID=A0A0G1C601_9BACT|nr:MAG: mismatch endonuclease Vsr protein [Parcubacteria group bacterium GW2011_GWB1_40_14]KKS80859.1 MAG: mismatch endonuclease Vsr protein [Candidatus Woesebacteria bacterium GW2011_GWC1_43_10b]